MGSVLFARTLDSITDTCITGSHCCISDLTTAEISDVPYCTIVVFSHSAIPLGDQAVHGKPHTEIRHDWGR